MRKQGLNPLLQQGKPLTEAHLDAVDQQANHAMPADLRRFYIEMGDGFRFVPNNISGSPLEGWETNWLGDYAIRMKDFSEMIEYEASEEIASGRQRADADLLRIEAENRKRWVPFYGFNGGGNFLCLDSEGKVRFYEAVYWRDIPSSWSFVLAHSLIDFVQKWSGFCFVEPGRPWTSFCRNLSGVFDWSPSHFPHGIDCNSLRVRS